MHIENRIIDLERELIATGEASILLLVQLIRYSATFMKEEEAIHFLDHEAKKISPEANRIQRAVAAVIVNE